MPPGTAAGRGGALRPPEQPANLRMAEPGFRAKQVHGQLPGVTDRVGPRRAEQGSHGHAGELGHDREDALGAGPQENRLDPHQQRGFKVTGAGHEIRTEVML